MKLSGFHCRHSVVLAAALLTAALAFAQSENVIYRFKGGSDGVSPFGALTYVNGTFFGTTAGGGSFGRGTVFQLTPPAVSGGGWTETVIYNFTGLDDGAGPDSALIADASGNLYGTTAAGGVNQTEVLGGVVFELSPPSSSGGTWTETVLHAFPASSGDGGSPAGDLTFDAAGNIYGVTAGGGTESALGCGSAGCGTVYQLKPPTAPGGSWTEAVLYNFLSSGSNDGFDPSTGVLVGAGGVLYGTTGFGGHQGVGTFYRLSPPSSGGMWTEKILYEFQGGADGSLPNALRVGKQGVLYGTTGLGGASGDGTVFQLTPPTSTSGWKESVLYSFTGGLDGAAPLSTVILDQLGNLYGTTTRGGSSSCRPGQGCGSVYKLALPATSGGAWTETTLHDFTGGRDGVQPEFGRLTPAKGAFFGTTALGGSPSGFGTVFSVRP